MMALGMSVTFSISRMLMCASAKPSAAPAIMATESRAAPGPENVAPRVTETASLYIRSAVASFSRLSPSMMTCTRYGIFRRRITAEAATASGGATMAPMAIAAAQDMSGIM